MTHEERIDLAKAIRTAATIYGTEIAPERLSAVLDAWEATGLPPSALTRCYRAIWKDFRQSRMPSIAEIIDFYFPDEKSVDKREIGAMIAAKIGDAVRKFGYPNGAEAKTFIGDDGWCAVQAFGGWQWVCENYGTYLLPTHMAQAQIRDLVAASKKLDEINNAKSENAAIEGADVIRQLGVKIKEL